MKQATNTILMVRPIGFRMNEETAVNNYFQQDINTANTEINKKAQSEFDQFVDKLRAKGIEVIVVHDTPSSDTPDSIFPNNWVSFHDDGTIGLYPMYAENRRKERRKDIIQILMDNGHQVSKTLDYTHFELQNKFLEGTGSILMDREHGKAYCALSGRADESLFRSFCEDFKCEPIVFTAYQTEGDKRLPIYHTNVMMCLGVKLAVICLDSIDDISERALVVKNLEKDYEDIIEISEAQVHQFAGNMLQVKGKNDELYLVMSTSAYRSLTPEQIQTIETSSSIIHSDLETIETCGGGSARCMMAEVFLPKA